MTPMECAEIIKTELRRCAKICQELYGWDSIRLNIDYDVRGTCAGKALKDQRVRFNLLLLMEQAPDAVRNVAAHEFAHTVVYRRWKEECKKRFLQGTYLSMETEIKHLSELVDGMPAPHGKEWRRTMRLFGHIPKRCHSFDVSRHKTR